MDVPRILDAISSPADLKVLDNEELAILAREIRQEIVATTSVTGGHVASSLGAVDIIVALESLLDMPRDRVVFDVGHQAYAHKLLTGRREAFKTLRTYGGLSGFTKPSESPYDVHPSGHASDSLSIATGLAKARQLKGTDEKVVALIGDASLAGGMAFEALNYMGNEQLPLVVILNDNEMSISRNVGALMKHLGNIRANSHYREAREGLQAAMEQGGPAARGLLGFGKNMKESLKQMVIPHTMIYESLGIVCTAPIDGHNIAELRDVLSLVLEMDGPALVHVVTRKGEGYEPARRDPEAFHGTGPYDIATGRALKKPGRAPSYTEVFGAALADEAANDADVVAITAAMTGGTGLKTFAAEFPSRFVDVGIAEEQAVGMAAGLSSGGKKPVVALYSTFMQRAVDQMIIDVALPEANVVFAFDRAGLVGDDGPTHHGVFDMVYTRMVPNMRVLAPSDEAELVHALHTALVLEGPVSLRYPRGEAEGAPLPDVPDGARGGRRGPARLRSHGGPSPRRRRAAVRRGHRVPRGGHALGEAAGCGGHRCGGGLPFGGHGGGGRHRGRRRRGRAGGAGPPGCHDACRHAGHPRPLHRPGSRAPTLRRPRPECRRHRRYGARGARLIEPHSQRASFSQNTCFFPW